MTVPSDSPSSSSSSSCDAHVMTSTELPSFPEVIKQQITSAAPLSPTSKSKSKSKSKSVSEPTEFNSHDSKANYAFLSDAEIGASRIFRLVCMFQYFMCRYFHSYSIQGLEKVDPTRGALFYTMHTTHSADIFATLCTIFIVTGRVGRSLIHRWIMLSYPFLKYFGSVAGERNAAHQLLTKGYWTAVIPGGAPEAMAGHEHAYELRWGERAGFAAVAMKAGVPLYPTFTVNMEEMRFNPIFFIWNQLNLFKPYDWIIKRDIPYITRAVYYIAMGVWWTCSFICIPVPVPVKLVIGPAVDYTADEDVAVVAQRAQVALQSLIDQHQGRRHVDHIAALRMRFNEQQLRYIAGVYVAIVAMFCMIVARFYW